MTAKRWLSTSNAARSAEWERLCRPFGRSPKVVLDACLAAFAVAGGYRLVTLDGAFGRFDGLDPIAERPLLREQSDGCSVAFALWLRMLCSFATIRSLFPVD
jgi:hypothetical protein